jgi:lipopolysaccharide export system permease protein
VRITEFKEYGVQIDNDNPVTMEEMAAQHAHQGLDRHG